MLKKYTPILTIAFMLAIVAFLGYMVPSKQENIPTRILLENIGGRVVFNHALHFENYGVACETCHHESPSLRENVKKCGDCHGVDFAAPNFKKDHLITFADDLDSCVTCHHMEFSSSKWNHDVHSQEYGLSCQDCHHKDTSIEPEPQNCSNCHASEGDDFIPGIKDSVHDKCILCHQDKFETAQGCAYCHTKVPMRQILQEKGTITVSQTYAECSVCHTGKKAQDLILERMTAFHGQCITCHEQEGQGPFTQSQCNQCHMK